MAEITLKQTTIGKYYIELSESNRHGETLFQVSRAYGVGAEYREDKHQVYEDLKKATAAYNRYQREITR